MAAKNIPLQIRPILILHNFACSLVSVYAFYGFLNGILQSDSMFQKGDSVILKPIYRIYWLTKLLELLDTVFMIVRHKRRQISFLHVYHHSSILLLSDVAYHMYPWPGIAFYLMNNSFVHIVLYTYYGLSALFQIDPFHGKDTLLSFRYSSFL
uniref:Elongation of very long chain fatty acids protein n=1 Tax=Crassostrea virginica TaxID=6565 RepID=A0A8B8CDZ4_CRAVI|nr:elongation of very long chain fatty acids protein 5-like [Crassostrea virginica]XP_022313994.1 elongation of very long chain fatty acids protein 5-like [Crassostrea virginica]